MTRHADRARELHQYIDDFSCQSENCAACADDRAAITRAFEEVERDASFELTQLRAENAKLRAVAEAARKRCKDAVPEWAPELRAALAALDGDKT